MTIAGLTIGFVAVFIAGWALGWRGGSAHGWLTALMFVDQRQRVLDREAMRWEK